MAVAPESTPTPVSEDHEADSNPFVEQEWQDVFDISTVETIDEMN